MAAKVIVFGPTGDVASVAARTAQAQGAKVFLAMRDPRKPIQGLTPAQEAQGGFERVQADLTKPETITAAVKQTGATTAFMYLAWQANDHMKATFEASKAAGINSMVFLSSFTIPANKPLDSVRPEDRIPYMHARAEMELSAVYDSKSYVALRPGAFAANTRRWRHGIKAGEVDLESPDTKYDYITPVDMGRVAGTILANGQRDGQNIAYLYGPQLMAQKDAIGIALTVLGKSKSVNVKLGQQGPSSDWFSKAYDNFQEGADNVRKYTGHPGTTYREWVEYNKERFDD